ncbi:MAG: DUF1631 domain-containing protein [Thioalkalispiraceae bacterium]|jgi:hypothetical protein
MPMKPTDNVVSFEDAKQDSISRRILLRKLLPVLKDLTVKQMTKVMQGMFDNADDTLFKIAESVGEGNEKNQYIDSMRIVRLQRTSIEKLFFEELQRIFSDYEEGNDSSLPTSEQPESALEMGSLKLMDDEDLEIQLAVENLIQKIKNAYGIELAAIDKRLNYLQGQEAPGPSLVPFSAEALVQAYKKATEKLKLPLQIQLIVFKLFDLHCIHNLSDLYNAINQSFINEGVLPVIKSKIIKQDDGQYSVPATHDPAAAATSSSQMASPGYGHPASQLSNPQWSDLQQMLNLQRNSASYNGPASGAGAGGHMQASATGTAGAGHTQTSATGAGQNVVPMPSEDMLAALTEMQSLAVDQLPTEGAHAVGNFLRVHLESAASEGEQQKAINPLDNDLIDIVCLVFEYILDDPHLPVVAKASIGRLQIPMLKVAMLDKQFFSMKGHPARDLLNLLASTAVSIDDNDSLDHPVLNKINQIVEYILENFTDDLSLFVEQTEELKQFISEHRKLEQEACEEINQVQQEKEELALAKAWVKETLNQHLAGRELAKPVADIILGPWKDVMLETYLQEGEHSDLWKTQIRFIDVLCWSVEPKKLKLDKNKLGAIIQHLIKTLREGLERIQYPQKEAEKIFNTLEPYHLASVHGLNLAECVLSGEEKQSVSEVLHSQSGHDEMTAQLEDMLSDEKVILENIVLEDWETSQDKDLEQIDDEYLTLARHLEMGKWVEFKGNDGGSRRAKLAWKSDLLGEYTFLNWRFDVIADKTLLELAEDLRDGNARIVEDVPLMDRALCSVVSSLIPKAK